MKKRCGKQAPSLEETSAGIPERGQWVAARLIDWFGSAARDLPWRHTTDPYAIWVSEVMLQQTQVIKVIPYWEKWMTRFPTVSVLARAELEEVYLFWQGLGYYTRARNLHRAAMEIESRHNGKFPDSPDQIRSLPGIGDYTCGAVCSIAFDLPEPVVDGNVIRVLSRFLNHTDEVSLSSSRRLLRTVADEVVRGADSQRSKSVPRPCSHANQALMELGATVCTPTAPGCLLCPLQRRCSGFANGTHLDLPVKKAARKPTDLYVTAWVLRKGRTMAAARSAEGQWNQGLHEFPSTKENTQFTPLDRLLESLPVRLEADSVREVGFTTHAITHHRIRIRVVEARVGNDGLSGPGDWKWVTFEEARRLPWSGAHLKILGMMETEASP